MLLAPIVLFVYNRPVHTQKVIEALQMNEESKHSDLFIFSDAPKNEIAIENVERVRNYIRTISGFKSIIIKEQIQNQGLAKSIINGVTEIVGKFGRVIVIEDDVETSPFFLKFMNSALDFFENEKRIWSITGFSYPLNKKKLPEAFCFFAISCWSWGTWADRWKHYEKNPDKYISQISKNGIKKFDYYGSTKMFSQITANKTGRLDTWAIFWYALQFVNNGFQIMPSRPLAKNIGMDGTGIHCGTNSIYNEHDLYMQEIKIDFDKIPIKENKLATKLICNFFKEQKKKKHIIIQAKKLTKRIIYKVFGKNLPSGKDTKRMAVFKCNSEWHGNEYGGFYICPDVLKNNEIIVYSAGIGEDISFDIDIINRYNNCKIFAFDPTPKSIKWVEKQSLHSNFNFYPYGISDKTGEEQMFLPKNSEHVSGSIYESEHLSKEDRIVVQMKSIESIIAENNHNYIDIIKMDIEGSEFRVLESLDFGKLNCGQILIEFHQRFFKDGKKMLRAAIKRLRKNNYFCFAVSNSEEEFSFINRAIFKNLNSRNFDP